MTETGQAALLSSAVPEETFTGYGAGDAEAVR